MVHLASPVLQQQGVHHTERPAVGVGHHTVLTHTVALRHTVVVAAGTAAAVADQELGLPAGQLKHLQGPCRLSLMELLLCAGLWAVCCVAAYWKNCRGTCLLL